MACAFLLTDDPGLLDDCPALGFWAIANAPAMLLAPHPAMTTPAPSVAKPPPETTRLVPPVSGARTSPPIDALPPPTFIWNAAAIWKAPVSPKPPARPSSNGTLLGAGDSASVA